MSDAVNLVKSLFPTARVTSTRRSPTSVLGRKNPRSYHNIGRAIDIAPIPGVTFKDYLSSVRGAFKDAGIDIVEALEEVGKGRSKYATGDHWHIAYSAPKASKPAVKAPETVNIAPAEAKGVDIPEAPDFDVEGATEENFASLLAKIGTGGKKKRKPKNKLPGILDGLF